MRMHALNLLGSATLTSGAHTSIGQLTLPAGDRWKILSVYGCAFPAAQAESNIELKLIALSGDVIPNPAPFKLPLAASSPAQSNPAVALVQQPIFYRTKFDGAGKSVIDFSLLQRGATGAVKYNCGLLLGNGKLDVASDVTYCDSVSANIPAATEVLVGTITLSERAKRITGISTQCVPNGAIAANEFLLGTVRIESNDVLLTPLTLPIHSAIQGSATAPNLTDPIISPFLPLDVDVPNGARINVYVKLLAALDSEATVYLAYE